MTGDTPAVRLGIAIPAGNTTLENELPVFGSGVSWHYQRFSQLIRTRDDLVAGTAAIVECCAVLKAARVEAVGVGYTAGSYTGGVAWDESLRSAIVDQTSCRAYTAASAIVDALDHLSVRAVAVFSPYSPEVNERAAAYLQESGLSVTGVAGEQPDGPAGDVTAEMILANVRQLDRGGADAVLISCTGLRTLGLVELLEDELGMPVVSSNLALLWAMGAGAGIQLSGPGRLMRATTRAE